MKQRDECTRSSRLEPPPKRLVTAIIITAVSAISVEVNPIIVLFVPISFGLAWIALDSTAPRRAFSLGA
jgi:hypothetical protein